MVFLRIVYASISFALFAGSAMAQEQVNVLYECDITRKSTGSWISDKMGIVIDAQGKAFVSDGTTLTFYNGPVAATKGRNNARVLVVHWRIDNAVSSGNQTVPTFDYTAKITKKSMKISVSATPNGYSNRFQGTGKCVVRPGK